MRSGNFEYQSERKLEIFNLAQTSLTLVILISTLEKGETDMGITLKKDIRRHWQFISHGAKVLD